jgi:hypothetical protein
MPAYALIIFCLAHISMPDSLLLVLIEMFVDGKKTSDHAPVWIELD